MFWFNWRFYSQLQVLCLHLKRFHWTAFLRNKVDTYVEFPLKGLDMRGYLLEVSSKQKKCRSWNFTIQFCISGNSINVLWKIPREKQVCQSGHSGNFIGITSVVLVGNITIPQELVVLLSNLNLCNEGVWFGNLKKESRHQSHHGKM